MATQALKALGMVDVLSQSQILWSFLEKKCDASSLFSVIFQGVLFIFQKSVRDPRRNINFGLCGLWAPLLHLRKQNLHVYLKTFPLVSLLLTWICSASIVYLFRKKEGRVLCDLNTVKLSAVSKQLINTPWNSGKECAYKARYRNLQVKGTFGSTPVVTEDGEGMSMFTNPPASRRTPTVEITAWRE